MESLPELSNEILLAYSPLKGTLFFPKWGWGRWNALAGEAASWRGGAFMRKRSAALQGLACQEAEAAIHKDATYNHMVVLHIVPQGLPFQGISIF